ncbi:hypothetical protein AGMMS50229_04200 [Campylobacterota bacterium]|nr:hypothetical protein AGMMS50229_04200 [Campylobacterota bacterium]
MKDRNAQLYCAPIEGCGFGNWRDRFIVAHNNDAANSSFALGGERYILLRSRRAKVDDINGADDNYSNTNDEDNPT